MAKKNTEAEEAKEVKEVIDVKEIPENEVAETAEAAEASEEQAEEKVEEKNEEVTAEDRTAEAAEDKIAEAAEEAEGAEEAPEETPAQLSSTEAKRKKKAERREAKAARKEANKLEQKKSRPNNLLLAILIFGVLIGMFAFVSGYNYFQKPASIEQYLEDYGYTEYYTDLPVSQYTTLKIRAEGNTLKILFTVDEDAPDDELDYFTGDDGTDYLKELGASFLTSIKPDVRGFGGTVKVGVKQGDETINYVKMSYSEAKKYIKEAEKEAEEEADAEGEEAEDTGDVEEEAEDSAETDD